MPSWYSDLFDSLFAYSGKRWQRKPRTERLKRDFQQERKRAEKLLNIFDVFFPDVKLVLAECNKRYEEIKYTHNVDDKLKKMVQLNGILDEFDNQMRECGLHVEPKGSYGKKRWY